MLQCFFNPVGLVCKPSGTNKSGLRVVSSGGRKKKKTGAEIKNKLCPLGKQTCLTVKALLKVNGHVVIVTLRLKGQ